MDILGVGPLELLFIFLIALIFLGPNDMVKAGRTLGRWMRKIVTSDAWREITRLRTLPNQLIREAGLEEDLKELNEIQKELPKALEFNDLNPPEASLSPTDPAQAPASEPAQAPATEPAQAPASEPAQAPASEPAQAPATEPAQAPATEPAQAPATEPAHASGPADLSDWTTPPAQGRDDSPPPALDESQRSATDGGMSTAET